MKAAPQGQVRASRAPHAARPGCAPRARPAAAALLAHPVQGGLHLLRSLRESDLVVVTCSPTLFADALQAVCAAKKDVRVLQAFDLRPLFKQPTATLSATTLDLPPAPMSPPASAPAPDAACVVAIKIEPQTPSRRSCRTGSRSRISSSPACPCWAHCFRPPARRCAGSIQVLLPVAAHMQAVPLCGPVMEASACTERNGAPSYSSMLCFAVQVIEAGVQCVAAASAAADATSRHCPGMLAAARRAVLGM